MNPHEEFILQCLVGPRYMLGKDLNLLLQKKFPNVTSGSARKILERAATSNKVRSSSPVTFGNGQFVYLLPGKVLDRSVVLDITKENRPPLFRILNLLDIQGGIISRYEALKITAAPLKADKSKSDSLEKIIRDLKLLGLVQEVNDSKGTSFLVSPGIDNADELISGRVNKMYMDAMFIPDILRSIKGMNIIDNDRVLYRNKSNPATGISYNNLKWDAIAYTRTTGINPGRSSQANTFDKQTLVVLDVIISRHYTDHDLQGFYSRIQSVSHSVKLGKRKILPIIVHAGLEDKKVLNTIRKLGFMSFDLGSIYGSNVYEIIKQLGAIKHNEQEGEDNTEEIEETLTGIESAGQEDNLSNLKGDLFEFLMYPLIKLLYPDTYPIHGRKIKPEIMEGEKIVEYEYDYIINSPRHPETVVMELKGYVSSIYISLGTWEKKNSIKWFFNRTLPVAKKKLEEENKTSAVRACFITTCNFEADGVEFLESMNQTKLKPTEMDCWYDGKKLLALLEQKNLTKVRQVVKRYYIKES